MKLILNVNILSALREDNDIMYESLVEVRAKFPNAIITPYMEDLENTEPLCVGWVKSYRFTNEFQEFIHVDEEWDEYVLMDMEE